MTKRAIWKQTIQQSEADDRDLFQLACPHYHTMNALIVAQLQQAITNHKSNEPIRILEIGAGTGTTALQFLLQQIQINKPIILTLLDNNRASLHLAKEKISQLKLKIGLEIKYIVNDVFDFFKENTNQFDITYSMFTLHNFHPQPREQLISAISASLTPWWILINADKIADNNPQQHIQHYQQTLEGYEVFAQHWRKDLQQERTAHNAQDEKIKRNEEEYKNLLEKNGLASIYESERMLMEKVIVSQKIT